MVIKLKKQIQNNLFRSFRFEEAGVAFSCDVELSGFADYRLYSRYLMRDSDSEENYFSLNFSMRLQE